MTTLYWLVKSEPTTYAWSDFFRDRRTDWTGVRNYAARLHLGRMRVGDPVLFYESGKPKSVVGTAIVAKPAFPDDTAGEPGWLAVELEAVSPLAHSVSLAQIRGEAALAGIELLRQPRLSVMPLTADAYKRIVKLGS